MILKKVDAVLVHVTNLDEGLAFYRDALGHALRWRTAAGSALGDSGTELVLATKEGPETDFLVDSVEEASRAFVAAGGSIVRGPLEIPVGRVVVVADPFGNELVLLDLSKSQYVTDASGNVTGVAQLPCGDGSL